MKDQVDRVSSPASSEEAFEASSDTSGSSKSIFTSTLGNKMQGSTRVAALPLDAIQQAIRKHKRPGLYPRRLTAG